MSDEETKAARKPREPKRNSIPTAEVEALVARIPQYEKASWLVVGHKNGVRLAVPRTNGISRAYFYADGDYAIIPDHPAIVTFSEEQRKEERRGGVTAEVNFGAGVDAAREALALLADVVRNAKAPVRAVRAPRTAKAVAPVAAKRPVTDETPDRMEHLDGDDAGDDAGADPEAS